MTIYTNQNSCIKLPSFITVEIVTIGNSKRVTIHSSIHVNKANTLTHTYGVCFSDQEILRDSDFLKHLNRYI